MSRTGGRSHEGGGSDRPANDTANDTAYDTACDISGYARSVRLGPDESRRRFKAARVVRLATSDAHGRPHAVPVTFALDGETLYFAVDHKPKRTHDLRRLRNISENPQVALVADDYADDWTTLWWTRADGHAAVIGDDSERAHALGMLQAKYPQYREQPPDGPVVAVTVTRWSGWSYS